MPDKPTAYIVEAAILEAVVKKLGELPWSESNPILAPLLQNARPYVEPEGCGCTPEEAV